MAGEKIFVADKETLDAVKVDTGAIRTDVAAIKADTATIKSDASAIKTTAATIKTTTDTIKTDTATIKTDVATTKTTTATIKTATDTLKTTTNTINTNVNTVKSTVSTVKSGVDTVKQDTATLKTDTATLKTTSAAILAEITGARPKRYGFRVKIGEANPSSRVEYLFDAVGMTPAFMNFSAGVFNYGSWRDIWFIRDNYPVMVKYDGTEGQRLNPNNYGMEMSWGSSSQVANASYGGNAMSAIPCCWVKRYTEGGYRYVIICETQYDESYKAYAHTRADGTIERVHYYPMFKGSMVSGKLRSLSGQYPQYSTTAQAERDAAKANGAKWDIRTWAMDELIADLLVLISKTTNGQAAFGQGQTSGYVSNASQHYGMIQTGTLNTKGQFFGYNDTTHQVKVFHIEGFWGERWDRLVGAVYKGGGWHIKMTPEGSGYNLTGAGYTPAAAGHGDLVDGEDSGGGYISTTIQNDYGLFPTAFSGSDATFECDCLWWDNSYDVCVCLRGGSLSNGSYCGPRSVHADIEPAVSGWSFGASLSCESPS